MKRNGAAFERLQYRKLNSKSQVLGCIGNLETRFARSAQEIRAAQALRYNVFYQELGARADAKTRVTRRDKDRFDHYCDHLLVLDKNLPEFRQIVGTCRVLDQNSALAAGGFYSQSEFDLSPLLNANAERRFLELGRSCIAAPYRSKRTIELMWQGIWATMLDRKIDMLFGCASFQGTNFEEHEKAFSWLAHNVVLDSSVDCPSVLRSRIPLNCLKGVVANDARSFASLPPLLKGYLRVGAKVASHAVIDHQFDTIDVLVVLDVGEISDKYIAHYGADASRFAA